MSGSRGALVLSLDFELDWGVQDHRPLSEYGPRLLGARAAIPRMLRAFRDRGVHATWATVGLLFFKDRESLLAALPSRRPRYADRSLDPYRLLERIGRGEEDDPYHFARSLIDAIAAVPGQEIASQTFSHYYCLEREQDVEAFRDDMKASLAAGKAAGQRVRSIVFPRNQFDAAHLAVCRDLGLLAYRGNEAGWMYRTTSREDLSLRQRAARLADAYADLSGHNTYDLGELAAEGPPYNVPSSRFLRPFSPRSRLLEGPRLARILSGLDHAAERGRLYHLWWHPHNFGAHLDENMAFLERILDRFAAHRDAGRMEALTMAEAAGKIAERGGARAS